MRITKFIWQTFPVVGLGLGIMSFVFTRQIYESLAEPLAFIISAIILTIVFLPIDILNMSLKRGETNGI